MRTACARAVLLAALLNSPLMAADGPLSYSPVWQDDMESGTGGWTHQDLTALRQPLFHIDAYHAFDDPSVPDDHSWWCGIQTAEYSGGDGYGNHWDQRLELPPIVLQAGVSSATSWGKVKAEFRPRGGASHAPPGVHPVLTFAVRYDSEPAYDFTYVEAVVDGVWVPLHNGYDGQSDGWIDLGPGGFDLSSCDDPLRIRFHFLSDPVWSDEDGLYDSDAGAFQVDNIRVFDAVTGLVFFADDAESLSACQPLVPPASGDYWHIAERACPAFSDPHCWWCGDDADTSWIPPWVWNALYSPPVQLGPGTCAPCTLYFRAHTEIPEVQVDYWRVSVTFDGGESWHSIGAWWGDMGQCDGWAQFGVSGLSLDGHVRPGTFMLRVDFSTDGTGCGPGAGGGAGLFIDDVALWASEGTRTREGSETARVARTSGLKMPVAPIGRLLVH